MNAPRWLLAASILASTAGCLLGEESSSAPPEEGEAEAAFTMNGVVYACYEPEPALNASEGGVQGCAVYHAVDTVGPVEGEFPDTIALEGLTYACTDRNDVIRDDDYVPAELPPGGCETYVRAGVAG